MQQAISVLVVEDEAIWAKQLELSLERLGLSIAGIYNNAEDALMQLSSIDFDVALLDISINGRNLGIELGKVIRTVYQKPFIFITGSTDKHTVDEAVGAGPSAYLIKPANDTSLFVAVQNAMDNFHQQKVASTAPASTSYDSFFVKLGNRYKKIEWNQVVALVSEKKYTKVLLASEATEYFINNTLTKTLQYLVPAFLKNSFVQVNRAEAVHTKFIEEVVGSCIKAARYQFEATEGYVKDVKAMLHMAP